jgi:hypothetical protein
MGGVVGNEMSIQRELILQQRADPAHDSGFLPVDDGVERPLALAWWRWREDRRDHRDLLLRVALVDIHHPFGGIGVQIDVVVERDDHVRFGSLERLRALIGDRADPRGLVDEPYAIPVICVGLDDLLLVRLPVVRRVDDAHFAWRSALRQHVFQALHEEIDAIVGADDHAPGERIHDEGSRIREVARGIASGPSPGCSPGTVGSGAQRGRSASVGCSA